MRDLFNLCMIMALVFAGTGCMTAVGNAVVRDVSWTCCPGVSRAQVIAVLGQPRQSRRFVPAVSYSSFADAPKRVKQQKQVSICDEYCVSGLTTTRSPYAGLYYDREAIAAVVTLGVSEVIYTVPAAALDLSARPFQRHPIWFWYDQSERVIVSDDGPEKSSKSH